LNFLCSDRDNSVSLLLGLLYKNRLLVALKDSVCVYAPGASESRGVDCWVTRCGRDELGG
jgi:hypothetical protein